jgi:hypothetical protein
MALLSKRQQSSFLSPWEPEISRCFCFSYVTWYLRLASITFTPTRWCWHRWARTSTPCLTVSAWTKSGVLTPRPARVSMFFSNNVSCCVMKIVTSYQKTHFVNVVGIGSAYRCEQLYKLLSDVKWSRNASHWLTHGGVHANGNSSNWTWYWKILKQKQCQILYHSNVRRCLQNYWVIWWVWNTLRHLFMKM